MKRPFSGVDLNFLVRELELTDGKIEKIYQFEKKEFIFRIYTPQAKKHLRIVLGETCHLTQKKYTGPKTPKGYVVFLRKYLTNARIRKVKQIGLERILVFEIETKTEKFELILEMFSPGNAILVKDGLVMHPLERQSFNTRDVKSKAKYEYPPSQTNLFSMSQKELEDHMKNSDLPLGKYLAVELSLGGVYSEEIVARSGLKKEAKANESFKVAKIVKEFFEEEINAHVSLGSAYPLEMKTVKTEKKYESFSSALDTFYNPTHKPAEKKSVRKDKYQVMISAQEKRIKKLEEQSELALKKGEFIYEKYQEFQKLLSAVEELKKKHSWIEIEEILKENKFVKKIDKKNKILHLEFK